MAANVTDLLTEYDSQRPVYVDFIQRLGSLIEMLLSEQSLRVVSVTRRLKDRASLERKMSRPEAAYETLSNVTDVAGLRITTYLADDVDRVGELIRNEFRIDYINSVDKRAVLDPDRFGYLSLHYVIHLNSARAKLAEYRRYTMPAEIQVRSVLQHAWAEIEHDLGYKSSIEVPRHIRRRFSRIAGLLELADQEFISIRDELAAYERSLPQQIAIAADTVTIDKASLEAFMENDVTVKKLDRYVATVLGAKLAGVDSESGLVDKWRKLGVATVADLRSEVVRHQDVVQRFVDAWIARRSKGKLPGGHIYCGISLFYLRYVLLAEKGDLEFARRMLSDVGLAHSAEDVFKVYSRLTG